MVSQSFNLSNHRIYFTSSVGELSYYIKNSLLSFALIILYRTSQLRLSTQLLLSKDNTYCLNWSHISGFCSIILLHQQLPSTIHCDPVQPAMFHVFQRTMHYSFNFSQPWSTLGRRNLVCTKFRINWISNPFVYFPIGLYYFLSHSRLWAGHKTCVRRTPSLCIVSIFS
jgi:hypothetical protein